MMSTRCVMLAGAAVIRCTVCSGALGPREPLDRHLLQESCIESLAARLAAIECFCHACGGPLERNPGMKSRFCPGCRHRHKFPGAAPKPLPKSGSKARAS